MALFLKQDGQRSELQERVASQLAERHSKTSGSDNSDALDTSTLEQESEESTGRAIFWVSVVLMSVIAAFAFVWLVS